MNNVVITVLAMTFVTGSSLAVETCTPGETKMDDCNSCFCTTHGYLCTEKKCQVTTKGTAAANDKPVCEAGQTRMEDCNYCFCLPDRSGYACTKKKCPEVPLTCQPRQQFKEYCNTCTCGNDGLRKNAACTRKGCAPGVWNRDGSSVNPEEQQS